MCYITQINCCQYWYVGIGEWCNIPMVPLPCSLLLPMTLIIVKVSSLLLLFKTLNYHRCSWDQMFKDVVNVMASSPQHEQLSTQKITSALTELRLNFNSLCIIQTIKLLPKLPKTQPKLSKKTRTHRKQLRFICLNSKLLRFEKIFG